MGNRVALLTVATVIFAASAGAASERPIRFRIEGGAAVSSVPYQYDGTMALPWLAPSGDVGLDVRIAPPILCSIDLNYFRVGPGSLAPEWGSIPENSCTTEPSNVQSALVGVRMVSLGPHPAPYLPAAIGVGQLRVGDERIFSMLGPDTTIPGGRDTGIAFAVGAGVHGEPHPLGLSLNLRWLGVSTKDGLVSVVPLSVGLMF